jgi:hypothetical protein
MKALGKKLIVRSDAPKYKGLIEGVTLNETTFAKTMSVGKDVTLVKLEDILIVDWKKATNIGGDMYSISEDDVMGIVED